MMKRKKAKEEEFIILWNGKLRNLMQEHTFLVYLFIYLFILFYFHLTFIHLF